MSGLHRGDGVGLPQSDLLPDACADAGYVIQGSRPWVGDRGAQSLELLALFDPIVEYAPWLLKVMPWSLLLPFGFGDKSPLAGCLMLGAPLPTVAPIIATVIWCVLFVGVTFWRIPAGRVLREGGRVLPAHLHPEHCLTFVRRSR